MAAKEVRLPEAEIISQFIAAMAENGLRTRDTIAPDGELHRFHIEGDANNTKNGFYVLHADTIPAGHFGSWKHGVSVKWCARVGGVIDPELRKKAMERIEDGERKRKQQDAEKNAAAADLALQLWEAASEDDADAHPYLERKAVRSHGLRVGRWTSGADALLVPMFDVEGNLHSLQAIFANSNPAIGRDKDFLKNGRKRGCFCPIGQTPAGAEQIIVIAEGYATGATIYEAQGHFTLVAFDAYNLAAVAQAARSKWPAACIIIAADNDRWTLQPIENPGVVKARQAANMVGAPVCIPDFPSLEDKPTDFNDLAAMCGMDEVRRQLGAVIPKPDNDNFLPISSGFNIHSYPHQMGNKPQDTAENLAYLFSQYGIQCRYNMVSKEVETEIPGVECTMDNRAAVHGAVIEGLCVRNMMPRASLETWKLAIADANSYNPAAEWIESRPWDGQDRIERLARTLDACSPALAEVLLRRYMIGAIGCVYSPGGMSMQGVLVLQGAQNAGKTTWFWQLANNDRALGKEGVSLDPNNRDSVMQSVSYWLVELGEIDATFSKADIAALKSFITKDTDELFKRYSRSASKFPRRTAFFGTVNPEQFLHDSTGNRRFWTIKCGPNLVALHGIDMQQVWAQVKTLYDSGEQHRLTRDELEMLNASNADHMESNPINELIASRYNWEETIGRRPMTASEVLIEIGYDRPSKPQTKEAGTALRTITGKEPRKSNGRLLFEVPRLITQHGYSQPY